MEANRGLNETKPNPLDSGETSTKGRFRRLLGACLAGAILAFAGMVLLIFLLTPADVDQKLTDLKSGGPHVRARALAWLAQADPDNSDRARVTAALEPALMDGDETGVLNPDLLLRTYLHWAGPDNVPSLIRMVENPTLPAWDSKKAGMVIETLGKLRDKRAIEAIADRLADPTLQDQAVNALKLIGRRAESEVLDHLFDDDPGVRDRAGRLLESYGTKTATIAGEALARLKSNQADIRSGAALWFAENPPDNEKEKAPVASLLTGLLEDLSPKANTLALRALKVWGTRDCLPQLLAFAKRVQKTGVADPELIDVLSQFPDQTAAEGIALQLKIPALRARAVQALLKLGPIATRTVLGYINHPDSGVRKEARSLARLLTIPSGRLLNQTLADLGDSRAPPSRTALRYLATLRPVPVQRAKVSRALNAPLLDPKPDVRADALNAVAVWGTKENTATLLKVLKDFPVGSPGEFQRLVTVLASLHDPAAGPVLAQGLTDCRARDVVSQALIAMGPAAEDAVIPFLRSPDEEAQMAACGILGEIGTQKSLDPLKKAMDSTPWTSPFVKEALVASQKIEARA
jgi:HEAT repeat protein